MWIVSSVVPRGVMSDLDVCANMAVVLSHLGDI